MDIAAGAKTLIVCMEHTTKDGAPKIVKAMHVSSDRSGLRGYHRQLTTVRVLRQDSNWSGRLTADNGTVERLMVSTQARPVRGYVHCFTIWGSVL